MTPEEKDYLEQLLENINKLQDFLLQQKKLIYAQHQEIEILSNELKELHLENLALKESYDNLRMTRVLVSSGKDWKESHNRLLKIQQDIQEALRLLKIE